MSKITKKDRIKVLEWQVKNLIQSMTNIEEWSSCADNMLTELNHALPDPEYDAKCEAAVAGIEASLDRHRERLGLNKPQLKQLDQSDDTAKELLEVDLSSELTGSELCRAMLARGDKCVLIRMGVRDDKQAKNIGRFAIATSIDESGRFNVMSDQQPISKVDFAIPINNQGEPLTASEVGL